MLVDRLRSPFVSNEFVNAGTHWLNGKATFVLCNRTYWPFDVPLVPRMVRVVPLKPMLVMRGTGGAVDTTLMIPLTARLFVFHARPAPGVAGVMEANEPP